MKARDSAGARSGGADRAAKPRGSGTSRVTRQRTPGADRAAKPHPASALKRERILEAAAQVFATQGYRKGSLIDIAELVGMTHAGVLHYFGTKDQLLIAVLERRDTSVLKDLEGQRMPVGPLFLQHLIDTAEMNSRRAGIVQTYAVLSAESVTSEHPAQPYFRQRFLGLREQIADAFGLAVPGDIPRERLMQAASSVIAVMDGLQVQWLLDPEAVEMTASVAAVIEAMTEWLRRGVADGAAAQTAD
jgi:AcrR family transcriptional regulator